MTYARVGYMKIKVMRRPQSHGVDTAFERTNTQPLNRKFHRPKLKNFYRRIKDMRR